MLVSYLCLLRLLNAMDTGATANPHTPRTDNLCLLTILHFLRCTVPHEEEGPRSCLVSTAEGRLISTVAAEAGGNQLKSAVPKALKMHKLKLKILRDTVR